MYSGEVVVSEVTLNMMKKRVLYKDGEGNQETPLDAYKRVAKFVAHGHSYFSTSEETKQFEELSIMMMADGKFMPNTPTLVNAGFQNAQCAACFVLPLEDNLKSIYETHANQGLVHSSGGGTGFYLGEIRPKGAKAADRFITKGPISWLRMLNENATHVAQGMREGANMAVLDVGHPDIVEFVNCKKQGYKISPELLAEQLNVSIEEAKRIKSIVGIEKFNLSVSITNLFMRAIENNDEWYFIDPHTKSKTGSMPARELWNLIVSNAWENGEPGIFFKDVTNAHNSLSHIGDINCTNPCVTGDTLIRTDRGLERMDAFVKDQRKNAKVLGMKGQWRGVKKFINNGIKSVWKVTTKSGYSVTATSDHKFPIVDGKLTKLKNLKPGQWLHLQPNVNTPFLNNDDDLEYEILGWLVGDGYLSHPKGSHQAGIIVGKYDANLIDWFISSIEKICGAKCKPYEFKESNTIHLMSNKIWRWAVTKMGATPVKSAYKRVPEKVFTAKKSNICAFMRGLFSADGHIRLTKKLGGSGKSNDIVFSSKSIGLLEDLQALFSLFGLRSTLLNRSRKKARNKLFSYVRKDGKKVHYGSDGKLYELYLYSDARKFFVQNIGLTEDSYKQSKLDKIPLKVAQNFRGHGLKDKIVSIEYAGEEEVFDITVDDPDGDMSMINNGLVTWDCGEKGMIPYSSCVLGHVNLSKFITGTNGTTRFDYSEFEKTIRFGAQFLDNIVEINSFPIKELEVMNKNSRQIGLGVMGWADALILMGVPYDSDEAINLINDIGAAFKNTLEDETTKMGRDRGNFPYFEGSKFQEDGIKYRRNSEVSTIAPTGQTSMYVGCSPSIEPNIFYVIRRNQADIEQVDYHPILFNVLQERGLDNAEIRDRLGNLGSIRKAYFLPEDIRSLFPTSHDVSWEWHVKHQASWQKYISSGVSKTINFHKSATKEEVSAAFKAAFESGCKGITVYRDGSRAGQPLSSLRKEENRHIKISNKRDRVTRGTNRKIPSGCGNLMVYIGEGEDGQIQEITTRLGKGGGCASAWAEAMARISSIALRYNVPPERIIRQLGGIRCHLTAFHKPINSDKSRVVTSCADAISVALTEHMTENNTLEDIDIDTNEHAGACPECGGQLVYEEGCNGGKCYNCGFSKCG